jgi:hypothetical protein
MLRPLLQHITGVLCNEIKNSKMYENTGEYTITPFLICDGRGESLFYHTYIRATRCGAAFGSKASTLAREGRRWQL